MRIATGNERIVIWQADGDEAAAGELPDHLAGCVDLARLVDVDVGHEVRALRCLANLAKLPVSAQAGVARVDGDRALYLTGRIELTQVGNSPTMHLANQKVPACERLDRGHFGAGWGSRMPDHGLGWRKRLDDGLV